MSLDAAFTACLKNFSFRNNRQAGMQFCAVQKVAQPRVVAGTPLNLLACLKNQISSYFSYEFMLDRQKSEIVQTILTNRCALFIFNAF